MTAMSVFEFIGYSPVLCGGKKLDQMVVRVQEEAVLCTTSWE